MFHFSARVSKITASFFFPPDDQKRWVQQVYWSFETSVPFLLQKSAQSHKVYFCPVWKPAPSHWCTLTTVVCFILQHRLTRQARSEQNTPFNGIGKESNKAVSFVYYFTASSDSIVLFLTDSIWDKRKIRLVCFSVWNLQAVGTEQQSHMFWLDRWCPHLVHHQLWLIAAVKHRL